MMKYVEVAKIMFKTQLIYRFDVAMTVLENIGKVLFAWLVWGAVFDGQGTIGGFHFEAMLFYYVVSSFISTLDLSWNVSGEVSWQIRNGRFSKYMVIPVNPKVYFLAKSLGTSAYYALFALPVAVICGMLFGVEVRIEQISVVLLGLIMIPIGTAFMVMYHYFIGLLAFKFQDVGLFRYVQATIIQFTQGGFLPLNLLPDVAFQIIRLLPFPHVVFTPTMLIMGRASLQEGLFSLGILIAWSFGLIVAIQIAYQRLRVRYDGVGA